jgi:hypothetical protein
MKEVYEALRRGVDGVSRSLEGASLDGTLEVKEG